MAKPKNNTRPTTGNPLILGLDAIAELEQDAQVALYVATENVVRCGFLQQGKILHCLGDGGLELLRAAGIRPTTLANARNAQWVFDTFINRLAENPVHIHNGTEVVPFSEAVFDTLTLRQCDLLRKSFSAMGTVAYRPSIEKARELVQLENWDDNIESYFEHGTDLAGIAQREQEAAAALEAEQRRVAEMERQIAALQTQQTTNPGASLPPPVISLNPEPEPAAQADDDNVDEHDGAPVDAIDADYEADHQEPEEESDGETADDPNAVHEDDAPVAEDPEETQEDPEPIETTAHENPLTPEEVGSAVADATDGITSRDTWDQAFDNFEETTAAFLEHADAAENQHMLDRLAALAARIEAAKPTPPATPAPKGRGRRKTATPERIAA